MLMLVTKVPLVCHQSVPLFVTKCPHACQHRDP